jgi:hypothetical protein
MTFYIRLAFTSGLALRIKGAAYFTKPQLSETDNSPRKCRRFPGTFFETFQVGRLIQSPTVFDNICTVPVCQRTKGSGHFLIRTSS